MMENKQTAVQWLMMQLPVFIRVDLYEKELYQQAKAMEQEQIEEAFNNSYWFIDGKEYYEKTFK